MERAELLLAWLSIDDTYDDPWVSLGHAIDDRGHEPRHQGFRAANPHLSGTGIGQEFDVPDALLQFVEHCNASFEQRVAIHGRLDSLRRSIKQPYAERMLEIGNHFRYSRLRNPELNGRLGHAAVLNNRVKHVQVAQPEPSADLTLPVDFFRHREVLISIKTNWEFLLYRSQANAANNARQIVQ